MKPDAGTLSLMAARILAVTPRAPRTQVDTVLAEIGILIGDLCETAEQAQKLTQHLVEHPQPRWNFEALRKQAVHFTTPPPPPPATPPLQWNGFECPEWVWKAPASDPGRANRLQEYVEAIDRELWRRVQSWTPQRRQQLEAEILAYMAEYQRQHPDSTVFTNPTPDQVKHYLILQAGRENAEARKTPGSLEPCPIPEPETAPAKVRPKTRRA